VKGSPLANGGALALENRVLFSGPGIWTMVHGIVFGGAALMALSAALFALYAARIRNRDAGSGGASRPAAESAAESRALAGLTVFVAVTLWLAVLVGTYVIFPPYRATPPAGLTDLSQYPRALIHASQDTAWLHSFAMESKEHLPWIASMLATAVAFVSVRYRSRVLTDARLRHMATTLLAICFALVAFVSLMGIFVNKVAPLY
jgi:hypothetical protein